MADNNANINYQHQLNNNTTQTIKIENDLLQQRTSSQQSQQQSQNMNLISQSSKTLQNSNNNNNSQHSTNTERIGTNNLRTSSITLHSNSNNNTVDSPSSIVITSNSSTNSYATENKISDGTLGDSGGGLNDGLVDEIVKSSTTAATVDDIDDDYLPINSNNNNINSNNNNQQQNSFLGRLTSKDNILLISDNLIEIGRNSSTSSVHFHVGKNSFVSRKHMQIHFNSKDNEFYLLCLSKNGVFVDGVFTRKSFESVKLPKSCTFRFPSTSIRITFENLINETNELNNGSKSIKTVENSNVILTPLKISIPEQERKSPFPSPTGTISAANSCPTSPRQGFQDYSTYPSSNNSNHFQNDMFHPPSTSYSEHEKPPYSYAQLIVQSISASPEKQLTLSGIYSFISKNYPYYRTGANKGWQNSIRHNLSLNRYFIKVPRSQDEPGKGSFWRIDPTSEMKLIDQSYRKRRQRGSQCFRSPFGMPRSAPVSPSHIDNSRENSPLHDITMQSAPGSPGNYHNNHSEPQCIEDVRNYGGQNIQQGYHSSNTYSSSTYISPTSAGSVKREHNSDIYDDSEEFTENEEYETLKRTKYNND